MAGRRAPCVCNLVGSEGWLRCVRLLRVRVHRQSQCRAITAGWPPNGFRKKFRCTVQKDMQADGEEHPTGNSNQGAFE